jgi:predicted RNA binding protein YcfA (HicA-like mRNA interferase family)
LYAVVAKFYIPYQMGKYEKTVSSILSGRSDQSIRFIELVNLLRAMGFNERVKGSHHIFYRQDVEEILNIQPNGSLAKAYQVKQVRNLILKYRMEIPNE